MTKNIVIFSDGTGQEGGKGHDTNVYKLFNMIEDRTEKQISFYDRGLGTGWRKITGNIAGMGMSKNILDCYEFIFEHYNAGDQVFLFGFSRGATTVRSLSAFIHLFGIFPKSRPELIKRAYKIYKIRDDKKREERVKDFRKKHHNHWCKIMFLGVWDTVAALGIPFKSIDVVVNLVPFFRHKFHNLNLSESVKHARHALAERGPQPELRLRRGRGQARRGRQECARALEAHGQSAAERGASRTPTRPGWRLAREENRPHAERT